MHEQLASVLKAAGAHELLPLLRVSEQGNLGREYEQWLGRTNRRARGVFYTPPELAERLADDVVGRTWDQRSAAQRADFRVLDPACGAGAFLTPALATLSRRWGAKASAMVWGADTDRAALEVARWTLAMKGHAPGLIHGSALHTLALRPGFDVVVGNPPWGQKGVRVKKERKRELAARFPSSAGIFDLFRPFVELAVRVLRPGGRLGLVLPDIVLLKNYEPTRRMLLAEMSIERIEHLGRAFGDAVMDSVLLVARRTAAARTQRVEVRMHGARRSVHSLLQADFAANPRATFNLGLTPPRRALVDRLARFPRLGDVYEVHEGVHSGNMRRELFVDGPVDESCCPIVVKGSEVDVRGIHWAGRYLRRSAAVRIGQNGVYASLGQARWHERPKVLVRRTGDRVIAAVDDEGIHASNNFFLVLPRSAAAPGLPLLARLLCSELITWWFRAVEPRQGRAFAELKVKHLVAMPLPHARDLASIDPDPDEATWRRVFGAPAALPE